MTPERAAQATMREGGITLGPDGERVTRGKVVAARFGSAKVVPPSPADIALAILQVQRSDPGTGVGTWLDGATGKVHVDPVDVVTTSEEADRLARLRGQLAWYDLDTNAEVRLDRRAA